MFWIDKKSWEEYSYNILKSLIEEVLVLSKKIKYFNRNKSKRLCKSIRLYKLQNLEDYESCIKGYKKKSKNERLKVTS